MLRKCKSKHQLMYGVFDREGAAIVVDWVNGSFKGTNLPLHEQEIEWWCKDKQTEKRAKFGDYIVQVRPGVFEAYSRTTFHLTYRDDDNIPF